MMRNMIEKDFNDDKSDDFQAKSEPFTEDSLISDEVEAAIKAVSPRPTSILKNSEPKSRHDSVSSSAATENNAKQATSSSAATTPTAKRVTIASSEDSDETDRDQFCEVVENSSTRWTMKLGVPDVFIKRPDSIKVKVS
jgi:hypothetical protein